jgi:hypothetical protein
MKKAVYILSALLCLCIVLLVLTIRVSSQDSEMITDMAIVNNSLAQQLFFDNLDEGTIEIFALPPEPSRSFEHGAYTIKVRRLYLLFPTDSSWVNFVEHNQGQALGFACHMWHEDRKLSLALIQLLSVPDNNARMLRHLIETEGATHADTVSFVTDEAEQYDLRLDQYRRSHHPPRCGKCSK